MNSSENKTKYNELMKLKEPEILENWRKEQDSLKTKLIKSMRLRKLPALHFIYDDSIAYGSYMDQRVSDVIKKDEEKDQ